MKNMLSIQSVLGAINSLILKQDNGLVAIIVAPIVPNTMTASHYKERKQND